MPLSPSDAAVLERIAELAGSRAPAKDRLEQVLGVIRETLGAGALSVVATGPAPGEFTAWHSAAGDSAADLAPLDQQALRLMGCGCRPGVMPLPEVDGYGAVVVAHDGWEGDSAPDVLRLSSGYLSLLVENARLADRADSSSRLAHRHMEEIATIYEIGQAMDPADVRPVLDMIVAKASAVMDAQACSLMLRDQRDGALVIEASYGLADDVVKGARIGFGDGIAGRVLETGEPVLIADVATDPRFREKVRPRVGISGSMCVPLKNEDGTMHGVLSIRRHEPKPPFSQEDLRLFSVFAAHAALAIANAQLYSRLHRKVQEMSTISDVMAAINSTLDLDCVLDRIVESITEVVGFDRCCVYLLDLRTSEFVAGARKGYGDTDVPRDRVKLGDGVIGLAAKERIPIFSQGSPVEINTQGGAGEFLAAPIMVRDQCIGVVVVDNCTPGRRIEPQHVELLATFVSQAGMAVENARLYEAMEEKYAELNVLYEHSRGISAAYGLENAADMLVHTASRAIRSDGAGLLLLDTKRGHLKLQASSGGMTRLAPEIERIAREDRCVNFVRDLRSAVLLSPDSPERSIGPNSDLLNAFGPPRSNLLLAPLVAEDTTIGVLALYRNQSEEFQGAEFKLISIVTSNAATVLKNAISFEQKMRQRVFELTALYEFSKKISSAANLEEALDSILLIVADLVDYDESFIYAIDHERGVVDVKASRFRDESQASHGAAPSPEPLDSGSVTCWAIKERKAFVSPDIRHDPRFRDAAAAERSVRSLMSIPLIVQDEVVGVLNVHGYSPNQYSEDDVRVLSIIASQGAAIYRELEALSALTSYTDNILSSIAAGVVTLDSDGTVLLWNSAAERVVGLKASRVYLWDYRHVLQRLPVSAADKESLTRAVEGVFETGETYQGYKLCFHPRNRDEVYVNMSISQLLNSAGEQLGLVLIFEDITREIKMENEFRRMGELAAVGQLAASIAHELRNPLSSIKGAAQFLQKEYEDHSSIVEFLGIIIEEVNGLNKLTTEFLEFARPMQLEFKPTSLNRMMEKTLQLMSVHITDNNVVVKDNLARSVPEIQADEGQLQRVLRNIIINALQAMPEGGVLTVETGSTPSGGAYMAVSDTGIGIPPGKIDWIFQPFVTTKTKGTGLGLSVVHKIVENHGGRIEVTSEVGRGSTFKVSLPHTGVRAPLTAEIDHTLEERRTSGKLRGDAGV